MSLPRLASEKRFPKFIWQSHSSWDGLPEVCEPGVRSWFSRNPEWNHQFCTEALVLEFLGAFCPREIRDLFGRLQSPGMKLDLWRYAILHEFGGVCSDIYTVCREPLDQWLDVEKGKGLHVACANNTPHFCHRTIAAAKGHPALALAIELIGERMVPNSGAIPWNPESESYHTGADLWTSAVCRYLGRKDEPMTLYHERSSFEHKDIEIHPCYFFDGVKVRCLSPSGPE